jgi:hypothetical protein
MQLKQQDTIFIADVAIREDFYCRLIRIWISSKLIAIRKNFIADRKRKYNENGGRIAARGFRENI